MSVTEIELLDASATIFGSLAAPTWEGVRFSGELQYSQSVLRSLEQLDADDRCTVWVGRQPVTTKQLISQVSHGATIRVTVEPPRSRSAFFSRDLNDLIASHDFRFAVPIDFFVAELKYRYPSSDRRPTEIQSYVDAVRFSDMLRILAHHRDERTSTVWYIFLERAEKIEIPIFYDSLDLRLLDGLDHFFSEVSDEKHSTVRIALARTAILEGVRLLEPDKRFRGMLASFAEIKQRFQDNFELYLSEFSFADERDKIEVEKREYLLKLNNAIGEIHTRLIAIPAAVVLVAGQMKQTISSAALVTNVVLLVGSLVFSCLMAVITVNQLQSLDAIAADFRGRRMRLKSQLKAELYNQFTDAFNLLEKRYSFQRRLVWLIDVLVLASFVSAVWVFAVQYDPTWRKSGSPQKESTSTSTHSPRRP